MHLFVPRSVTPRRIMIKSSLERSFSLFKPVDWLVLGTMINTFHVQLSGQGQASSESERERVSRCFHQELSGGVDVAALCTTFEAIRHP